MKKWFLSPTHKDKLFCTVVLEHLTYNSFSCNNKAVPKPEPVWKQSLQSAAAYLSLVFAQQSHFTTNAPHVPAADSDSGLKSNAVDPKTSKLQKTYEIWREGWGEKNKAKMRKRTKQQELSRRSTYQHCIVIGSVFFLAKPKVFQPQHH